MNLHSLFIIKTSGVCLYSRNFTNEFKDVDVNLITPFFSAILHFSKNVVKRKLEELEIGGLRFTFYIESDFVFILIADNSVSLLFTISRLISIADAFFRIYYQLDKLREYQEIENPEFDKLIDSIISGEEELFKKKVFYQKIIDLFKNLLLENEIAGAALLSTSGNIIYSSLPKDILLNSVKELEIRFISGVLDLPESFYSLESGEKVFSTIITAEAISVYSFFVVLLFESSVQLGMAELILLKTIKAIKELIKSLK
ncbi:MAG TPA: hypothetical protein VGB37_07030 [Candidatus Lokiarchaeia archaeon]